MGITLFRLITAALLPVVFAVIFYMLEKKTKFGEMNYWKRQIIIGATFGVIASLATEFGIPVEGATLNIRNSAPLTAGLLFGGPAGLIAGTIGATHRFFSVYWGVSEYTRIACTLGTLFAGFVGAGCRKFMFDNKKASWFYGFAIGLTTEVLHMVLVFLTHMNDVYTVFKIIKICAAPMIFFNAISVSLSLLIISLIGKEKPLIFKYEKRPISNIFGFFLLICVVLAFSATCLFTYSVQTSISRQDAELLLSSNVNDVETDIDFAIENKIDLGSEIRTAVKNRRIGKNGNIIVYDENFNYIADGEDRGENFFPIEQLVESDKYLNITVENAEYYVYYVDYKQCHIVALIPMSEVTLNRDISVYIVMFMEVIIFAALFAHIYFLIKRLVVDNIHKVNDSLSEITGGNLNVLVDVKGNEEFALLSDDINKTVLALKHYIKEAETRIDSELEFARQIQISALPRKFPAFPSRKDFDIYASMHAAKEVGGDFYDFYLRDKYTLIFVVADVSGKGVPGAMCMMRTKTLLRDLVESGKPIDEVFTLTNAKLCEDNEAGMFVTAWMGALDLKTGKLNFVNAGHNPPLIKKEDGNYEYIKSRPNFILAGMEGVKYRLNEIQLGVGDEIFIYTDGVTEATDDSERLFGEDRLQSSLILSSGLSPEEICKKVNSDVEAFVGKAPQFDDITMMSIKLKCIQGDNAFIAKPSLDSTSVALGYIERRGRALEIEPKLISKLQIAVDEIYSNIVSYSKATLSKISMNVLGGDVILKFIDNGERYDPTSSQEPDTTLSAEDRQIGGLGIFMVKKSSKSMEYEYNNSEGLNILTLIF